MDFFKQDEIDLLVLWSKEDYNKAKDKDAYNTLKGLYDKVGYWAESVKSEFAPNGRMKIVRKPTNQANKFERYQWAKIYPQADSNPKLAYTLSLEESDFIIKIDTVGQNSIRSEYESYRGEWGNSEIVIFISSDEVLTMNWESFTKRTIQELQKLEPHYLKLQNILFQSNDSISIKDNDSVLTTQKQPNMNPRNIILYGPPGTGKTYHTIDLAVSLTEGNIENGKDHSTNKEAFDKLKKEGQIEFITFHQNYSYEDFMVGLRPHTEGSSTEGSPLTFRKHEGIFYKLCKVARENYFSSLKDGYSKEPVFEDVIDIFLQPLIDDKEEIEVKMKSVGYSFHITGITEDKQRLHFRKQNLGTGHDLSLNTIKSIYEGDNSRSQQGLGVYYYPLIEQLRQISEKLTIKVNTELKQYVLIIDEINRANISRVFGELITLLEDDKRIGKPHELRIKLPNGEAELFGIPPNLHVVGTMNTADKSIALVDIALRRRFEFIGKYPNYEAKDNYTQEMADLLKILNNNIYAVKKTADFLIGHAYFMKNEAIETVIKNKIIPLLMEYFSNRNEEVKKIFEGTNWEIKYNTDSYDWDITLKNKEA
jgi:AAA domain (dynein-related subfamily)